MKNYKNMVITLGILYVLAVVIFAVVAGQSDKGKELRMSDGVKLNDIVYDAGDCLDNLCNLDNNNYITKYIITDTEGNILYKSHSNNIDSDKMSVETAIKKGYLYRPIIVNDRIRGYAIITRNSYDQYSGMLKRIIIGLSVVGVILIICAATFGMYVNKRIYTPFKNMKDFAGSVAQGNLDTPLAMDEDNMFGAFTESFDIMREELKSSKLREIALLKRERELVASLSHDLKTPITGIKLTCELLDAKFKASNESSDIADKVDNIYKKADQIDVLVSDLFSSTLDDLGEFKVNSTDENSDVLSDIVNKYDDKGLASSNEVPEAIIHIDVKCMSQVVGNIISNSYKYAKTPIEVTYRLVEDYIEMSIKDSGPGIPANELNLVTNKFYRGKEWEDSKEEGSGLGLYIAKTLMEKMDGELILESKGDGLKVILMIPLS